MVTLSVNSQELSITFSPLIKWEFEKKDFKIPCISFLNTCFSHTWVSVGKLENNPVLVKTAALARQLGIQTMHIPQGNAAKLLELNFLLQRWAEHPSEKESRSRIIPSLLTYTEHALIPLIALQQQSLSELPPIFHLPMFNKTQALDASNNQLTTLPSLKGLTYLRSLNLRGNPLREVPHVVRELNNLRHIDLSSTEMTEYPACLDSLSRLKTIDLRNNPLSQACLEEVQKRKASGLKIIV